MTKIRLIFVSVIILIVLSVYIVPAQAENEATGFTVKSMSCNVPIISNSALKNATCIILIGNSGGQSIVGDFGNDTIAKFLTGVLIKYPFKIEIGNVKETAKYSILNKGQLYEYVSHNIEAPGFPDLWKGAECDNSTFCFPTRTVRFGVGPDRIVAVNRVPIGMIADLSEADIYIEVIATITINGVSYSEVIGSGDGNKGSVNFYTNNGEFIANMKWVGSTVTGISPPDSDSYVAIYTVKSKEWKIASVTYYDEYLKSLYEIDSAFNRIKSEGYGHRLENGFVYYCKDEICSDVIEQINIHNSNLKRLIDRNDQIGYGSATSVSSTITTKRENDKLWGNVIDTLNVAITNPEFVITAKASKLQLYVPVGISRIESVSSPEFSSGDNDAIVYIKVKNIGEATGTFTACLTDKNEIFTSKSSTTITVPKGETGTILMFINSISSEAQNATVNVTVYDVNNPDAKSTSFTDVQIKMSTPKICKPDEYRLFGNEVFKCNNDGTDEIVVLRCNNGLIRYTDDKNYICDSIDINTKADFYPLESVSSANKDSEVHIEEPVEESKESIFTYILYGIASFLLLTSILVIITKFRNGDEKITKENIDKSMCIAGISIGILFIIVQFAALNQSLGVTLWLIIVLILVIVLVINGISYVNLQRFLSLKVSVIIVLLLFIILTAIASNMKDMMCGNILTSWLFSNCEQFSLKNFIFK